DATLHFADVGLAEKGDQTPVISVPVLNLDGIDVDLRQRQISIVTIAMNDTTDRVWRNSDGSVNLQALFTPVTEQSGDAEPSAAAKSNESPWTVAIKEASITNHTIHFEDRSVVLPMRTNVTKLSVKTHDVVFPFKGPIPLTVEHKLNETGLVSADGQIVVKPFQLDLDLALSNVAIQPFQPYLERFARITVDSGAIDLDGKVRFASEHPNGPLLAFRGNLGVKALSIADGDEGNPVAGWKQVQLSNIALTLDPTSVAIEEVGISHPTVHLVIDQDGKSNIKKLLAPDGAATKPPAAKETTAPAKN